MSIRRELLVNLTVFAAVLLAALGYLAFGVYHWSPFKDYYRVAMTVPDTDLVLSDTGVFVSGVRTGQVASVDVVPEGAVLTLEVPRDQRIPAASTVEIGMQSALGEPYVNFRPTGSAGPYLRDGDQIAARNVDAPESSPGFFDQLTTLGNVLSADPMSGLLRTVWQSLDGTDQAMGRVSDGTRLISAVLLSRSVQLSTMFSATQVYTGDLDWLIDGMPQLAPQAKTLLDAYGRVLRGMEPAVYEAHMYEAFHDTIDPFLAKLNPYLKKILPNVRDSLDPIVPILGAINDTLPMINMSEFLSMALKLFGARGAARLVVTPTSPR